MHLGQPPTSNCVCEAGRQEQGNQQRRRRPSRPRNAEKGLRVPSWPKADVLEDVAMLKDVDLLTDAEALVDADGLEETDALVDAEMVKDVDVLKDAEALVDAEVLENADTIVDANALVDVEMLKDADALVMNLMNKHVHLLLLGANFTKLSGLSFGLRLKAILIHIVLFALLMCL
ncbi:hypothetical protein PHYSODRAFT_327702 [Phytophthora sojae]|uniref:Uncharacterized protein n=1 Tax=Phytophthora sojae (strain P6497) TaxID=1094619 RepID=G4Z4D4_PHYSP|nr:hypothetical protein PHYSODRAFT_327702 [Phytophthora sojae]EGZ19440.1 hypothetical protein PHYSODRAFT_327702 [Phytophthora sojae]|eukprot:XP_009522157.1 hypothetical protein PHYSODRAFT_327702 [Phytophthora sojae]